MSLVKHLDVYPQVKALKNLLLGHNELTALPEQLGVHQVFTACLVITMTTS